MKTQNSIITEKIITIGLIVWLVFGLMAAGMFIRARKNVEFKVPLVIVFPTLLLGPIMFFGFLEMDDKQIAQHLDDRAKEVIRLREKNAELTKQKEVMPP
jgi:hypothetical protein